MLSVASGDDTFAIEVELVSPNETGEERGGSGSVNQEVGPSGQNEITSLGSNASGGRKKTTAPCIGEGEDDLAKK